MVERRIDIYINADGWIVDVLGFPDDVVGWQEHLELLAHSLEVGVTAHPDTTSGQTHQFRSSVGVWPYTERISVVVTVEGTYVWSSRNAEPTRDVLRDVLDHASGGVGGFAILDGSGTGHQCNPVGEA